MNILIRNLSKIITEDELMEKFRPFGVVTSVTIVMDSLTGLSKGFGFVEMPDQHEAEAAIRTLDRTRILKNKVRIKKTNAKLRSSDSAEYNKPQTTTGQPAVLRQESGASQPTQAVRPMFKPGYIKHHSRQIAANANSKFPPRDAVRKEYSPRGERPSGQYGSTGRSSKPYGKFSNRNNNSSRPAWPAPRGERPAYKTFSKPFDPKRRDGAPSRFPSSDSARKEYPSRGEKPFSSHSSGERSARPFSKFVKSGSSRPSWPAPRGAKPRFK